jgi:hypothetical protein
MSSTLTPLEESLRQAASSSKLEAERCEEEQDRVQGELKRLRNAVDRLESESKRLRFSQEEAGRLTKTLEFEAICMALRRNEPSLVELPRAYAFPVGYAEPLGQSLDKNTHVSSIDIDCVNLMPLTYKKESNNQEKKKRTVDPLVKFLRTSVTLRRVVFHRWYDGVLSGSKVGKALYKILVGACFRNRYIQDLIVDYGCLPMTSLRKCRLTTSLKTLHISVSSPTHFWQEDLQLIMSTFRAFSSLSNLLISGEHLSVMEAMLRGVLAAGCQLEELDLDCTNVDDDPVPELWQTLSALLSSTRQMSHLHLRNVRFDTQNMRELVSGFMRRADGTLQISISKLTLHECRFSSDATRLLVEFMNTRVEPQGNGSPCLTSMLRDLVIDNTDSGCTDLSSTALISMLCMQPALGLAPAASEEKWCPTIGSQIHSLSLNPFEDCFPEFFDLVEECSSRINLTKLEMSNIYDNEEVLRIAKFIPIIKSLRTLNMDSFMEDVSSVSPILSALRENGNVTSIAMEYSGSAVKSDSAIKLAEAYAKRNQCLDELLLKSTASEEEICPEVIHAESVAGKSLHPTLMEAAKQIPCNRASRLLHTLCFLGDSIGVSHEGACP